MKPSDMTGAAAVRPAEWPDWPVHGLVDDIRPALAELLRAAAPFALATLVEVEGSAPRPVGSQMLIAADERVQGYVSGGCVEGDLAVRARAVIETGAPVLVHYGRGSGNWDIRLTCGGRIGVFVQRIAPGDPAPAAIVEAGEARRAAALVIDLRSGALRAEAVGPGPPRADAQEGVFTRIYTPPVRLLIIGGDPAALALAALAKPLGMEVHINRPFGPGAPPPGLAGGCYHNGSADDFLDMLGIDPWTAVLCLSHDLDLDHAVLRRVLPSRALYAGALGSRRYRARRLERLRADGVAEEALLRLKTPVGLAIGARTAPEIALAILADIVAARREA